MDPAYANAPLPPYTGPVPPPPPPPPPPAPGPSEPPRFSLLDCCFRPGRFHERFTDRLPLAAVFPFIWIAALGATIDRFWTNQFTGQWNEHFNNWAIITVVILLLSLPTGVFFFGFRAGWYWVRLKICDTATPQRDWHAACRLPMVCELIAALPIILVYTLDVFRFPDPTAAWNSQSAVSLITIPFLFLATLSSYLGVRRVLRPKGTLRALLFFLIIPWLWQGAVLAVFFALAWFGIAATPAAVDSPVAWKGDSFAFQMPANWNVDTQDPDHDPWSYVTVETPNDAVVTVSAYWSEREPDEELAFTRARLEDDGFTLEGTADNNPFAGHDAASWTGTATLVGVPYDFRQYAFRTADDNWTIEIFWMCIDNSMSATKPGLDLIERTLTFTHPTHQRPITDRTREWSSNDLALEYPWNWWVVPELTEPDPATRQAATGAVSVELAADAWATIQLYEPLGSVAEELDSTRTLSENEGARFLNTQPIDALGPIPGRGHVHTVMYDGDEVYTYRVLIVPLADGRFLELREHVVETERTRLSAGMSLLWRTLTFPERKPQAPEPNPDPATNPAPGP